MTKLDKIVKGISDLSFDELRDLANSLSDILLNADAGVDDLISSPEKLMCVLYDWSREWQCEDVEASKPDQSPQQLDERGHLR